MVDVMKDWFLVLSFFSVLFLLALGVPAALIYWGVWLFKYL
jgi:hypothetical protein